MGSDRSFWLLFGGIWLFVGVAFLAATAGINLFADPAALNTDTPLWLFALAGLACCGFGAFILRRSVVAMRRERRLRQAGIPVTAIVTDVRRSLIEINRQTRWIVCFRYDFAGSALTGESGAMHGVEVADFKPGDRVTIKVDPQQPEDSLFLGAG
jgi:Co/Zn/Cd efflux system component